MDQSFRSEAALRVRAPRGISPHAPRPSRLARVCSPALARLVLVALAVGGIGRRSGAQEVIADLVPIPISASTGEKPQSKVWQHAGTWWAVLPSTAFSNPGDDGTWLWRLQADDSWASVLRLSSSTGATADALPVGDVTHVLLYQGTTTDLVSIEYDAPADTYLLWSQRPASTRISLANSEIATIDVDSTGRLWLATENGSSVVVHYSDPPYRSFTGPVVIASGVGSDDISVITSLHNGTIGVLWSNQNARQFGFRVHVDGTAPSVWLADEIPAAGGITNGVADDHLNVATASDGTLFAAVKTSFNTLGHAQIALLVRRPDASGPGGTWENRSQPEEVYALDDHGTRGIVLLNEGTAAVRVVYTSETGGGDIVYRESPTAPIAFGSRGVLIDGSLNDATSTKQNWIDEVVILASRGSNAEGVRIARSTTVSSTTTTTTTTTLVTTTTVPTTTTTVAAATTTTTTVTGPTTTTLPSAVTTLAVRVAANADDAEERVSDGRMLVGSSDLELVREASEQVVGMRFVGVAIPRDATIVSASVQFQVDEATTEATQLTIRGQAADQALAFTTAARNISTRPTTTESVEWPVPPWPVVGVQGDGQRSVDIAAIIREIVVRPGWASGNALALIVTGSGKRVAEAREGSATGAPLLRVEYTPPVAP